MTNQEQIEQDLEYIETDMHQFEAHGYPMFKRVAAALRLSMGREERLRGALLAIVNDDESCGDSCATRMQRVAKAALSEVAEGAENEGRRKP